MILLSGYHAGGHKDIQFLERNNEPSMHLV